MFLLCHQALQMRDHTSFDIHLEDGTSIHPNIRVSRCSKEDLKWIWEYINKTGAQLVGTSDHSATLK